MVGRRHPLLGTLDNGTRVILEGVDSRLLRTLTALDRIFTPGAIRAMRLQGYQFIVSDGQDTFRDYESMHQGGRAVDIRSLPSMPRMRVGSQSLSGRQAQEQ